MSPEIFAESNENVSFPSPPPAEIIDEILLVKLYVSAPAPPFRVNVPVLGDVLMLKVSAPFPPVAVIFLVKA